MKNFALIGAAGYIAPRHMKAIKDTNGKLIAALDKHDSVGILDTHFPKSDFFTEFERFDRHLDLLKRQGVGIDFVSICSPNYLHDSHIRFALRHQAHAICEKPLVLNPHNIKALKIIEKETNKRIYNVLQLRLHPNVLELKEQVTQEIKKNKHKVFDIDLTYITSRGRWYAHSWKGFDDKSGGIATNIGVHFYDMLGWIFGDVQRNEVHYKTPDACSGYLVFEHARVRWFLSINEDYLPDNIKEKKLRTYRSLTIDEKEIEFSHGFTDLHTLSYQKILEGKGFDLEEASKSIEIVSNIRNQEVVRNTNEQHPLLSSINKKQSKTINLGI